MGSEPDEIDDIVFLNFRETTPFSDCVVPWWSLRSGETWGFEAHNEWALGFCDAVEWHSKNY